MMKSMQKLVKWNGELKRNKRWSWRKCYVCAGMYVVTTLNNPHTTSFNVHVPLRPNFCDPRAFDSLPLWYLIANRKNDIKRNCCRKIKQENQLKGWNCLAVFKLGIHFHFYIYGNIKKGWVKREWHHNNMIYV